jgi:NADH dehydrogenase/NADH:ubiquinone oxidoreductase subunit G
MCLIEILNSPKPVVSCALPVLNNMQIFLDTPLVKNSRENIIESLLLNHPLDCPVCDQGGECDLQDQTKIFGSNKSRFFLNKRTVENKYCNTLIKTIMTRCIHCTRCVRYNTEIAGNEFFGTLNRGGHTEIGSYSSSYFDSKISSGVIDLCPVGALTSKQYSFKARPWELRTTESIDLSDGFGRNIYISSKELDIVRIFPKKGSSLDENIISDKARFYFDFNQHNRLELNNLNIKSLQNILRSNSVRSTASIIADNSADFNLLFFLKGLNNIYIKTKNFYLKSFSISQSFSKNYNISNLTNSLGELQKLQKYVFIFASNLEIENSILSAKFRLYQKNFNLSLLGFVNSFSQINNLFFLSITTFYVHKLLAGKLNNLSSILVKTNKPLFLFGSAFFSRDYNQNFFISFIKKISPKGIFININNNANKNSNSFLNVKALNTNILKSNLLICINTEESFFIRKFIYKFLKINTKNIVYWINTHKSSIIKEKGVVAIPTLSCFELEGLFINLEQRIQNTNKIVSNKNSNILSSIQIVVNLLNLKFSPIKINFYMLHLFFFKEMLKKIDLFDSIFNFNFIKIKLLTVFDNFFINTSFYPLKTQVEDFYLSNKNLKNSLLMQNTSKENRKSSSNFL